MASGETGGIPEEPGHVAFADMPDSDRKRYQLLNDDSSRMHPVKTSDQSLFTIRESTNSGTHLAKYPLKKKKFKRRVGGQSVNLGFTSSNSLAPDK